MSESTSSTSDTNSSDVSTATITTPASATKIWGTSGTVTAENRGAEMTLRSKNSMDSVLVMAKSQFSVNERFIPDDSTAGLILRTYKGALNGIPTTVSFNSGETLSIMKQRTARE